MNKKVFLFFVFFLLCFDVFCQNEKLAETQYNDAMVLVKENKFQEALTPLNKAITLNPKYYQAFTQAGIVLTRLNNPGDALTCLKTAVKLKKDYTVAYQALGALYKNSIGKPDSALYYFKKLRLFKADTTAEINYNIAWCFNALKKEDSAIKYLIKALDIDNNYKPAYREIAYSYHKLKKFDDAIKQFNKNLSISVNDLPVYYLGLLYMETNQKEKMNEKLTELKALNPKMAETLQRRIDERNKKSQ